MIRDIFQAMGLFDNIRWVDSGDLLASRALDPLVVDKQPGGLSPSVAIGGCKLN